MSISLPLFFQQNKNEYNTHLFLTQALKYFNDIQCYLCKKRHPPKFHVFVKRTYKEDRTSIVRTLVPRLWCEHNYNIRRKTGKKKQYTLTILPGFLVPHSTIPLEDILNSAEQYIFKPEISEQEAALLMHCENVSSFRLYFSRIKERLGRWILFLVECIIALGGEIKQDGVTSGEEYTQPLKCKWRRLTQLIEQYMALYSSLKGAQLMLSGFYTQYILVRLSHQKMGLGP